MLQSKARGFSQAESDVKERKRTLRPSISPDPTDHISSTAAAEE